MAYNLEVMKYSLEKQFPLEFHAGFKAVHDVTHIIHGYGYIPIYVLGYRMNNIGIHIVQDIFRVFALIYKIHKDDVCFLQWPYYSKLCYLLYIVLRLKHPHLQLLIHDFESIREQHRYEIEWKFLSLAEVIIAHTKEMKNYFVEGGINPNKVRILTSFDYFINDADKVPQRLLNGNIVFAGNLEKSVFLSKIPQYGSDICFFCYGGKVDALNTNLVYKGKFNPNEVSSIEGAWGLVWDGTSIETCDGVMGEYLKKNASHKLSLYIVARLPIIIWEKAAMANYVKEKKLGMVVNSINEIPDVIRSLSQEEYLRILSNIDKERDDLINGVHLKVIMDQLQ